MTVLFSDRGTTQPDAPADFGPGRRCARCQGRVSRYQAETHGALYCYRCQRERIDLLLDDAPAFAFLLGMRRAMRVRGISQRELASRLGVSVPAVSELSRGKAKASRERARRVADAIGCDVGELL